MRSLWRLNAPNIACDPCLYQFSASHFRRVFTYAGYTTYVQFATEICICAALCFPMQIHLIRRTSRPRKITSRRIVPLKGDRPTTSPVNLTLDETQNSDSFPFYLAFFTVARNCQRESPGVAGDGSSWDPRGRIVADRSGNRTR